MKEIRIALVGLGPRAIHWLSLIQKISGYRVVALCDTIPALRDAARKEVASDAKVAMYERFEQVLEDRDVEAVALLVRSKEQGAMAAAALRAGKHVHSEVPAAHTIDDCWQIVTAAERSGMLYHLADQTRFWGFIEAWTTLVKEGTLGQVMFCEGQYFHYWKSERFFYDQHTGRRLSVEELPAHPDAKRYWLHDMPPIHYLPHELSPLLKVLDDRVVEVVGMGTESPSRENPAIPMPDIQVALMKTLKGTILRLAVTFRLPGPETGERMHWYHVKGTKGFVEWSRADQDKPKLWLANRQMHQAADVDWKFERTDAPAEAAGTGHGDADYYVHAAFRDALLHGKKPELDLYGSIDTAAPAILAAESIAQGSKLLRVPDFRPGANRKSGEMPTTS